MSDVSINNVSDTALWVAVYRAKESQRPDALFQDPLAGRLAGERGKVIAASMSGTRQTEWAVVLRTYIIDAYVTERTNAGVDTVINLGAGLDTRPYRMNLPPSLNWIEVDFPHMIQHKQEQLSNEKPKCRLERVGIDLSNDQARQAFLAQAAAKSANILVLTEGVVPYLTQEQVALLATDLGAHASFRYWILDYFSPKLVPYFMSRTRVRQMRNAPFRFFPQDWFAFFKNLGWQTGEIRYVGEESVRLGRHIPAPWWVEVLTFIFRLKPKGEHLRYLAYVMLEPVKRS